jgi:uncharacterized protein YndB with AHSA1/START domain
MEFSTTRISKASKDAVWRAIEDLDNYVNWGDKTSDRYKKNHHVSVKVTSREGNVATCEIEEVGAGRLAKNVYKMTFYPKEKWEFELIGGTTKERLGKENDLHSVVTLTETPQGTRIDWKYLVTLRSLRGKFIGLFAPIMFRGVADEYCKQLAEYAEAHP